MWSLATHMRMAPMLRWAWEKEEAGFPFLGRQNVSRGALHRLQGTLSLGDFHDTLPVPLCEETDSTCPHGQIQFFSQIIKTRSWLTIAIHSLPHSLFMFRHLSSAVSSTMQNHFTKSFVKPTLGILGFNCKLMDSSAIQLQCHRGVQEQIKRYQVFL